MRRFGRPVHFDLPVGFARYDDAYGEIRAMSADGLLLKVTRHENTEGADLQFWTDLIRRSLVENRGISAKKPRTITSKEGASGKMIEGSKELEGKKHRYQVAIAMHKKHIYIYEAWGEESRFRKKASQVEASIKSMKILPFWERGFR